MKQAQRDENCYRNENKQASNYHDQGLPYERTRRTTDNQQMGLTVFFPLTLTVNKYFLSHKTFAEDENGFSSRVSFCYKKEKWNLRIQSQ